MDNSNRFRRLEVCPAHSFTTTFRTASQDSSRPLVKRIWLNCVLRISYCVNIASQDLSRPLVTRFKVLFKMCITHFILRQYCVNIASILRQYCVNIAPTDSSRPLVKGFKIIFKMRITHFILRQQIGHSVW